MQRLSINESDVNNVVSSSFRRILEDHLIRSTPNQKGYPVRSPVRRFGRIGEHVPETLVVFHVPPDPGLIKRRQGRQPHSSICLDNSVSRVHHVAGFGGEAEVCWKDLEPRTPSGEVLPQHTVRIC